jgi:hypothetical protein
VETLRWPTAIARRSWRLHDDFAPRLHSVYGEFKATPKRLHYYSTAIAQRSRDVRGDSKVFALRPRGIFTAIAASPFE